MTEPRTVAALPRGVVTFLLTDLEGSSHLWESHPEEMADVVQRHYDLLHNVVRAHHGALPLEQGEGDSVVAAFERGSDAVAAAVTAQRAILAESWPVGIEIRVRMALHSGEARLRDPENYVGEAIIRAARVRELGHGGQVLVSRACAEVVADTLPPGVDFRDLGPYRLKNLGRAEEIFQLCHPDLPDVFGPLRGIDQVANNLPTQLTPFIGREADLAQVHALVEDSRLLTLTGSGGCGKTRLALQVAADLVDVHADGIWYVELAPLGQTSSVLASIADVLRVQASAEVALLDAVVQRLRDRRALLVIDNCEHLLDDAAATIDALLRGSPSLRVLATSRQPLNLPGEVSWRVPSLAIPDPSETAVQTVEQFGAVRLFIDRAVRSRPNFAVTADNAPAIAAICHHLDGIPLAIELAAARVRSLSVDRILDGLQDRFRLLTGGSRAGLPRHQTLRSSVEWSHQLLADDERVLLRRLSGFSGGFTLDAAEAIAGFPPLDAYGILDHLAALVERSLVILDDEGTVERYRLLETIKQFAHEQLVASGEVGDVLDRHLVHFAGVVAVVAPDLQTGRQEQARAVLAAEHENLRTALVHAEQAAAVDPLSTLAFDLVHYWFQAGHAAVGIEWLDRAVARLGADDHLWRGRLLWGRALLSLYYGDWQAGALAAEGAVASATECGDDLALGRAMDIIADFGQMADPLGEIPVLEQALRHATAAGDSWSRCNIAQKIAWSLHYADRFHEVPARLDQALALLDGDPNPFFLAWHHIGHGTAAAMAGRPGAVEQARVAKEHSDRSGEPLTRAWSTGLLVTALVARGEYDEAEGAIELARQELEADGAAESAMRPLVLADLRRRTATGVDLPTRDEVQRILDDLAAGQVVWGVAQTLHPLLDAHLQQDPAATGPLVDELLQAAHQLGSEYLQAVCAMARAHALAVAGDPAAAAEQALQALGLLQDRDVDPTVCSALDLLAWANALGGDAERAGRWSGVAARTRASLGLVPTALQRAVITATDGVSSTAVDEVARGAASVQDRDLADVVELALRSRGRRLRPDTGWPSLSPTELEVVACVAEGLTNPQIAERLIMSRSTVKTHLGHIYAKVGISSRAELAVLHAAHR